jgi:hypothetical protein
MTQGELLNQLELLTEEQMAALLGISVKTLQKRVCAGSQHPPYIPGRKRLYPVKDYWAWARKRMVRPRDLQ